MLEKLGKKRRIGKRVVRVISHLVLHVRTGRAAPYLLSGNTLRHRLNGSSARRHIRVVQLHAANQLHHGSRAETDLPLFVGFPDSGNGFLSKSLHERSEKRRLEISICASSLKENPSCPLKSVLFKTTYVGYVEKWLS